MSAPYRDADGVACPRCERAMLPDERGDLACLDGCGTWLAREVVVELVGGLAFAALAAPTSWAEPLGRAPCPSCGDGLDEVIAALADGALVCGRCERHGVWIVRGDRTSFAAAFSPPPTREETLEQRVVALERRVAALERLLDH
ncbi:MAG TPA: hypothetical protein VMJ10_28765 [Kofleriaceae bacterium]|nr:hypothetical protein [Kofleriaceae bacterium]